MKDTIKKNPLAVIFFTVFVDLLGFGILFPIVSPLLADPTAPYFILQPGTPVSTGYILLGLLIATFPLGQFFAAPILGQLSDKFGRKKILALSLGGSCLSYIVFAIGILTRNIPLLFISRIVGGVTGGSVSVAQAVVSDITTPEKRSKSFGLIGAAMGFGFIMGPYIGGKLSDPKVMSWFNASTPFWFAAGLALLNTLSILLLLTETHRQINVKIKIDWSKSIHDIVSAYKKVNLRAIFFTNFFFQGGFAFLTTFLSVVLINKFGFTESNIGDFFSFVAIWIAVTQGVFAGWLTKFIKEDLILNISLIGLSLATFAYFLPSSAHGLFILAPFFALFNGLTQTMITVLVSRSAHEKIQGEVMGLNSSVSALAQSIPPILSGFVAASIAPETPIIISAIVIALSWITFITFYRKS